MLESEKLSAIIGDIYDAALDPTLWSDVVLRAITYIGGRAGGLTSRDAVNKSGDVNIAVGMSEAYLKSYAEEYVKIDPTTPRFFFFEIGDIIETEDTLPFPEFYATRFYKEWAEPQGWCDAASTLLEKTITSYASFSVLRHRDDGLVDESTRQRLRLLAPHLRRALLIGKVIDLQKAEAATLADTLDSIAAGLFLVDVTGRVVQANVSGHHILAEGTVFRAGNGRLACQDVAAEDALREAILASRGGDSHLDNRGIAVPMVSTGGQRYVAHVLPLTSGARKRAGVGYDSVAAIFVRKAAVDTLSSPEIIARSFGITPAELRVLLSVMESSGVAEIAQSLGVSEPTVRTHLRRLFEKTGTDRQTELVKLVAGYSSPF